MDLINRFLLNIFNQHFELKQLLYMAQTLLENVIIISLIHTSFSGGVHRRIEMRLLHGADGFAGFKDNSAGN